MLKTEGAPFQLSLFYDAEYEQWLQADWYDLRFLAFQTIGNTNSEVVYRPGSAELLVPLAERWPLLYERALVLASGLLPSISTDREWLKYQGISRELCTLLADKLNLLVMEVNHA